MLVVDLGAELDQGPDHVPVLRDGDIGDQRIASPIEDVEVGAERFHQLQATRVVVEDELHHHRVAVRLARVGIAPRPEDGEHDLPAMRRGAHALHGEADGPAPVPGDRVRQGAGPQQRVDRTGTLRVHRDHQRRDVEPADGVDPGTFRARPSDARGIVGADGHFQRGLGPGWEVLVGGGSHCDL